jgi:hypothetical protein
MKEKNENLNFLREIERKKWSIHVGGSDDDDRHYLSKYVHNPPISRKLDDLTRYLKFDHCETNSNDTLEFWSSMADS